MHRLVMNCRKYDGQIIDHINQDKLDNRKSNLRPVTHLQNRQNVLTVQGKIVGIYRVAKAVPGQIRGVDAGFRATACVNQRQITLGVFPTFEEALKARVDFCAEHFGEYSPFHGIDWRRIRLVDNKPQLNVDDRDSLDG